MNREGFSGIKPNFNVTLDFLGEDDNDALKVCISKADM